MSNSPRVHRIFQFAGYLYIRISGEAQGGGLPFLGKQHFGEGEAQVLTAELGPQHLF